MVEKSKLIWEQLSNISVCLSFPEPSEFVLLPGHNTEWCWPLLLRKFVWWESKTDRWRLLFPTFHHKTLPGESPQAFCSWMKFLACHSSSQLSKGEDPSPTRRFPSHSWRGVGTFRGRFGHPKVSSQGKWMIPGIIYGKDCILQILSLWNCLFCHFITKCGQKSRLGSLLLASVSYRFNYIFFPH